MLLLKGYTSLSESIEFNIGDCPILVKMNEVALVGIPDSKIFELNTVVRGHPERKYFEGDEIYTCDDKMIGHIIYSGGFKLQETDGLIKELPELEHIRVKGGNKKSAKLISKSPERTPITFKYRDMQVSIPSFVMKKGDMIVVAGTGFLIRPESLLFNTGLINVETGDNIYFGNILDGGVVELKDNLPAIKLLNNSYKSITI